MIFSYVVFSPGSRRPRFSCNRDTRSRQTASRFASSVTSRGEYVPWELSTISCSLSNVWAIWVISFPEYSFTSVKWSRRRFMVEVRAYAAGASLFRPIVMKKRDRSWKHPSNTWSTVMNHILDLCSNMWKLWFEDTHLGSVLLDGHFEYHLVAWPVQLLYRTMA